MPVIGTLDELTDFIAHRKRLYVRWSLGPDVDLPALASRDDLTGIALPGLSASPLDVEPWWSERPLRLWAARRLYDYAHLPQVKGHRVRPWLLRAREIGRGPDNEPLVTGIEPLGWIDRAVIDEAVEEIRRQRGRWGTLDRTGLGRTP
ncbi:DUF6098 family protein [Streptomyces sp. NPDC086989]|uniref:DUF6098 family protein n=1 Tax=Streptomyces sp. NPDC086989 TaxID=3365764 RepID=UPI0038021DF0